MAKPNTTRERQSSAVHYLSVEAMRSPYLGRVMRPPKSTVEALQDPDSLTFQAWDAALDSARRKYRVRPRYLDEIAPEAWPLEKVPHDVLNERARELTEEN